MDYKGYNISDVQSEILLDILKAQQEMLELLKRLDKPNIEAATKQLPFDSPEVTEAITEAAKQIETSGKQVKPTKKPVQRKPAKKKTKTKKATK
jgi:hypothetical protein